MGKKPNFYNKAISILQDLKKTYPNQELGEHLSTALGEYGDLYRVSDKEILFALEKYKLEKETEMESETEVDKIYQDGINLNSSFLYEDEEDDF